MSRKPVLAFSVLAVASLSSGCHRDGSTSRDAVPEPSAEDAIAENVVMNRLSSADPGCKGGVASLGEQVVWRWREGKIARESADFSDFRSSDGNDGAGLRGGVVAATIVGYRQSQTGRCNVAGGDVRCSENGDFRLDGGRDFRLCRRDGEYPRASLEAVALTTALTLQEAAQTYAQAGGGEIAPLISLVQPDIYTDYTVRQSGASDLRRLRKLDNAIWSRTSVSVNGITQRRGLVAIFPASQDFSSRNGAGALGLWEIPFVVAHEFGHHAFYQNLPAFQPLVDGPQAASLGTRAVQGDESWKTSADELRKAFSHGLPGPSLPWFSHGAQGRPRTVSTHDAMTVFNEAFADMFAHVHTKGSSKSISALQGVCSNRTMELGSFRYAGQEIPKALSSLRLQNFMSESEAGEKPLDADGCLPVEDQSPYTLAAILAHGFVGLTQGRSDELGILLAWAKDLDRQLATPGHSPASLLVAGTQDLIRQVARRGALSPRQCDVVREVFPVALDTAFASETGCR